MNLTQVRHDLGERLRAAHEDGVAVHAVPPSNLTAPAVVVAGQSGERVSGCVVDTVWSITHVGPGGDNEAGLTALETMLTASLRAVLGMPSARVVWDAPETVTVSERQLLAQRLTVTVSHLME